METTEKIEVEALGFYLASSEDVSYQMCSILNGSKKCDCGYHYEESLTDFKFRVWEVGNES